MVVVGEMVTGVGAAMDWRRRVRDASPGPRGNRMLRNESWV